MCIPVLKVWSKYGHVIQKIKRKAFVLIKLILFHFQILILGDSEPRSKFVDFLLAQPTMGSFSENCSGSECLAKPNGFYSGKIPWIGLPSSIQVNNKSDLIEFSCLVSDENLELSFTHENNGKILEASSISVRCRP